MVRKIPFVLLASFGIFAGYIAFWVALYQVTHLPGWICIIAGMITLGLINHYLEKRECSGRICKLCGHRGLRKIDDVSDGLGYQRGMVLECPSCSRVQI